MTKTPNLRRSRSLDVDKRRSKENGKDGALCSLYKYIYLVCGALVVGGLYSWNATLLPFRSVFSEGRAVKFSREERQSRVLGTSVACDISFAGLWSKVINPIRAFVQEKYKHSSRIAYTTDQQFGITLWIKGSTDSHFQNVNSKLREYLSHHAILMRTRQVSDAKILAVFWKYK